MCRGLGTWRCNKSGGFSCGSRGCLFLVLSGSLSREDNELVENHVFWDPFFCSFVCQVFLDSFLFLFNSSLTRCSNLSFLTRYKLPGTFVYVFLHTRHAYDWEQVQTVVSSRSILKITYCRALKPLFVFQSWKCSWFTRNEASFESPELFPLQPFHLSQEIL